MQESSERRVKMKKLLRFVSWLLPVAAVIVAVLIWPRLSEDRPECPHDWTDHDTTSTNHLSIPDAITNVPEYHDCQRFLVKNEDGNLVYDSLEAIFVRYDLETLYRIHPRSKDLESLGAVPVDSELKPNGLLVVGQVLSYGDYAPLGIKSGSDCLVLDWRSNGNETKYEAWMVSVGDNGDRCKTESPGHLIEDPNLVKLDVALVRTVGVVPPVSRWDWDAKDSLQYIGIACPTGWCEIHSPGRYQSSPLYSEYLDPITKGLYDEQYLATYVSGKITHDGITFGTIYPDPLLAHQTMSTYRSGWQPVAWVALRTASTAYKEKLNFDPASPLKVPLSGLADRKNSALLNEVDLCFVPTGKVGCEYVGAHFPKYCPTDYTNHGTWYARETPPAGVVRAPTITCTEFRFYPGNQAPPVVRWRWEKDDETMWISCPAGCCQVKVKV
jgi:hypothetical protein